MNNEDTNKLPYGQFNNLKASNKRCTCGCRVTYGDDFPIEYHTDYCDLRLKEKSIVDQLDLTKGGIYETKD